MARSMFERYGGFTAISKVVMAFYDKVLDSDVVGRYFDDVDMRRLIDHQTKFVATLMGGPASYTNETLRQVHARLHIDQTAFDEVLALFEETLEELEFERDDIEVVLTELHRRAPFIVTEQHA